MNFFFENFFFYSPLDQFEISVFYMNTFHMNIYFFYKVFLKLHYDESGLLYIFNLFSSYCFFVYFSIFFLHTKFGTIQYFFPRSYWNYYAEKIFNYFYFMLVQNFEFKIFFNKSFMFLVTTFFLIYFSNILGLIPFGFTITSFPVKCLSLSVSVFIGLTILGIILQGSHFFEHFLPKGIPLFLMPMIFVIEIISYVSKAFSLSIRLFANMMSGHILLNILSSFCFKLDVLSIIIAFFPFVLVFLISFLEIGICALQAYVFMLLLSLYFNDSCKFDDKFFSTRNIQGQLWTRCCKSIFLLETRADMNYNKLFNLKMAYEYERRIFLGRLCNLSEYTSIILELDEEDALSMLDFRLYYNSTVNYIKLQAGQTFIHYFLDDEFVSNTYLSLRCAVCSDRHHHSWFGREEEQIEKLLGEIVKLEIHNHIRLATYPYSKIEDDKEPEDDKKAEDDKKFKYNKKLEDDFISEEDEYEYYSDDYIEYSDFDEYSYSDSGEGEKKV